MFPCDLVKEKALAFGLHPKLKGKIFLAGGLAKIPIGSTAILISWFLFQKWKPSVLF